MKTGSPVALYALVCAAGFLSCNPTSGDGTFPFSSSDKVVSLRGPWKFAHGDDRLWSTREYDDSEWESVNVPDNWLARDLSGTGIGWYRTWIVVGSVDTFDDASIWLRGNLNSGDVFWDGALVGHFGSSDEQHEHALGTARYAHFRLGTTMTPGRRLLAVRIVSSLAVAGGIEEAPYLGSFNEILSQSERSKTLFGFLAGIFILSGIHLLMLFAGDRVRREYLYFALLSFMSATFVLLVEIPELVGTASMYSMIWRIPSPLLLSLPVFLYLFLAGKFEFHIQWLKRVIVAASVCLALPNLLPVQLIQQYSWVIALRDLWIQLGFLISLFVVGWAVWKRKPGSRTLVAGAFAIALGAIASFAKQDSVWGFSGAALFIVMMTVSLSREMSRIQREVRNTRDTFRLFVPEPVLDRIAKRGLESIHLGGAEEGVATILFIDIKSFTSVAEQLSPNQTLDFLNAFMQRMQPHIGAHGGFINQFVGDEIMAIFHRPGHGVAAVETAIAVRRELDAINTQRKEKGEPPIDAGMGINSGGIIWGTIGSEVRMESAVIGDPVNLASRLQSLTRHYGAFILGSEYLVQHIPDMARYAYREVDIVRVKGKSHAVAVYEFFDGDPEPLRSQKRTIVEPFMQGIVRYRAHEWEPAEALFAQCLNTCPADLIARMYIDRCQSMRKSPPGSSWGGVTIHDRK